MQCVTFKSIDNKSTWRREFPGGLVVRIWSFHCHGLGSISSLGTCKLPGVGKKI